MTMPDNDEVLMTPCPSREILIDLLGGRLDPEPLEATEIHVGTCRICQQRALNIAGELEPKFLLLLDQSTAPFESDSFGVSGDESPSSTLIQRLQELGPPCVERHPADELLTVIDQPWGMLPNVPGYEVLEEIGHGGTSLVFKARQISHDRIVALKQLQIGPRSSRIQRKRAFRGSQALSELNHPNIVQIYERFEYQDHYFGAIEYLEGGSLARAEGEPLRTARETAEIVRVIALAVQYIHDRGIVHRDLKPANILVTSDGIPKLADFGLARLFTEPSDLTDSDAIMGTPQYMAPEQALGKSNEIGPATDIHALGTILYELLTGHPPFRGETRQDAMQQVIYISPIPPSRVVGDVPHELEVICLKCLDKNPKLRYPSAESVANELASYLEGHRIENDKIRAWHRAAEHVRRRRREWIFALTSGLVLMTSGWIISIEHQRLQTVRAALEDSENSLYHQQIEMASMAIKDRDFALARKILDRCLPKPGRRDYRDQAWSQLSAIVSTGLNGQSQ
jgi:serine/threonine-protein kinase